MHSIKNVTPQTQTENGNSTLLYYETMNSLLLVILNRIVVELLISVLK